VVSNGTIRILEEDTQILGITIPKNTNVHFPHYTIHRDKKVWGEDANEFKPERIWHNDSFLPFTISPRDCLGSFLSFPSNLMKVRK